MLAWVDAGVGEQNGEVAVAMLATRARIRSRSARLLNVELHFAVYRMKATQKTIRARCSIARLGVSIEPSRQALSSAP